MFLTRWDTYVLQAAHEVVADRRARQVGRVRAAPDVEEVVRAQHGVVLLGVARGGEDPVHQDGHLTRPFKMAEGKEKQKGDLKPNRKKWPDYFMPHLLVCVELALMLTLGGNYKNRVL